MTQNLPPGKYYALDIESNKSAPLEVTGSGGGSQPTAGPVVEATEYSFKATGLKTGKQTVLFDNKGKQPHFVVALPINPGKTIADVKKVVATEGEPSGPPPIDEKSGVDTAVLDGGGNRRSARPQEEGQVRPHVLHPRPPGRTAPRGQGNGVRGDRELEGKVGRHVLEAWRLAVPQVAEMASEALAHTP